MDAVIVGLVVPGELLFECIPGLGVVCDFLYVLEEVVDVLGLGELLEDAFLVSLEYFLLVLDHLPVLVVVVAEDVVDLLDGQGPVHPLDVL